MRGSIRIAEYILHMPDLSHPQQGSQFCLQHTLAGVRTSTLTPRAPQKHQRICSRCRLEAYLVLAHALLAALARVQAKALPRAHTACTKASALMEALLY